MRSSVDRRRIRLFLEVGSRSEGETGLFFNRRIFFQDALDKLGQRETVATSILRHEIHELTLVGFPLNAGRGVITGPLG